jgi:membrane-bound lytic murein transglycosylase D
MRLSALFLLSTLFLFSGTVDQRYPSCNYVLSEFDIDSSYSRDDSFKQFVTNYEASLKRFYQRSLRRGEGVVSMLRGELLEEGMTDLFLYVSIVESGLSMDALSPKSAAGLWQFMPKTARSYNLEVCYGVDERCDPYSATRAAIRHLQNLHKRFGKWYLAVMAYNCGEGRLQKAIDAASTDDIEVLLDEQAKYLPRETRDYMKKILLIAMIGEDEMIDFAPSEKSDEPVRVKVAGGTTLKTIASVTGIPLSTLEAMNGKFPDGKIPVQKPVYEILIPESEMARFYLRYRLPEERGEPKPNLVSHQVVLGDTLGSIAKEYGSSEAEIMVVNHLEQDALEVGRILLVPISQKMFDSLLR